MFILIGFQYKIPILATIVFLCSLAFISFCAIIGFEQARQNQNQWYLVIPKTSLGMRIALLLSWPVLSIEAMTANRGIGFFIWDTFNSGDSSGIPSLVIGVFILAFGLDQFVDLSSLFLCKALKSNNNSQSVS